MARRNRTRTTQRRLTWGTALLAAGVGVTATAATAATAPARAASPNSLPHGCASLSRDHKAEFDPATRSFGLSVNVDKPCTFVYAEGDTFSGSGRFTVSCETGGFLHHRDVHDGGEFANPPVALVPIPQPCDVGAVVTLDGYQSGTGGGVIGGGLGTGPALPMVSNGSDRYTKLCAPGTPTAARVDLDPPVDYSGQLVFSGKVRCDGATVTIGSLTARPYGEYRSAAAPSASCANCHGPLTTSGTIPADTWIFEVVMEFTVSRPGRTPVTDRRARRYLAHWAGEVQPL